MYEIIKTHIDELGSPFFKKNRVSVDRDDKFKRNLQVTYDIIDSIKKGDNRQQILDKYKDKVHVTSNTEKSKIARVSELYAKAWRVVDSEYNKKNKYVIGLHIERYNQEINKILGTDYKDMMLHEDYEKDIVLKLQKKSNELFTVIDLLHRKEKLLQIHNPKLTLRLNQRNNLVINKKQNIQDLSKLTLEEKIEMLRYLDKMKSGDSVEYTRRNEIVEEIEEAEIVETSRSIDRILNVVTKEEQIEQEVNTVDSLLSKIKNTLIQSEKRKQEEDGDKMSLWE